MFSDRLVSPKLILDAHLHLQRVGNTKLMEELEQLEPDLAEWLMEGLSLIHQKLSATGLSTKRLLGLQRRIEGLVLVCLHAQRQTYRLFWQESSTKGLEHLDPDVEEPDRSQSAGEGNLPSP